MKTLYVSDLDGTLLRDDAALSDWSYQVLSELLADGLPFTVASARSVVSIRKMLAGLALPLPVIEFNGAFLSDLETGRHVLTRPLDPGMVELLIDEIQELGHSPFVSTFEGNRDRLYCGPVRNEGMNWYVKDRREHQDDRLTMVDDVRLGKHDDVVCLTVIGDRCEMRKLDDKVRSQRAESLQTHCMENRYSTGWHWLTIHDRRATKHEAAKELMSRYGLGAAELVVFGDNVNDEGLFKIADRAIAVANATTAIKRLADEVIGSNNEDSVVRYLQDEWLSRD